MAKRARKIFGEMRLTPVKVEGVMPERILEIWLRDTDW